MSNPRGYIKYVLAADAETSGLAFKCEKPTINTDTGEQYQMVSVGLVVVNADTYEEVDELYVEIKPIDGFTWSPQAEKVHGLSQSYLKQNGLTEEQAATAIGNLIMKYWGPTSSLCLLGHNVATFDLHFLRDMLYRHGLMFSFGSKHIDTNSIGHAVFSTHNSDDLFECIGVSREGTHDALDDAKAAVKVVRTVRALSKVMLGNG